MQLRTFIIATAATASLAGAGASARWLLEARAPAASGEVVRLRAHFDSVDAELRARDVSGLSAAQRAKRARLIAALRDYRDAGVFPVNTDFPGERVPYFVDHAGTRCAMAELIAVSGRRDIVDRIALTRNNAYIHALVDDAALVAWLDSAGLTVDEAARIQPKYEGPICAPCLPGAPCPPCPSVPESPSQLTSEYTALSTAAIAGGLFSLALNTTDSRTGRDGRWHEVLGFTAGAIGVGAGAARWENGGNVGRVALANTVVGAGAIALAARHLVHRRSVLAARSRGSSVPPSADRISVTVTPGIPGSRASPALSVKVAF